MQSGMEETVMSELKVLSQTFDCMLPHKPLNCFVLHCHFDCISQMANYARSHDCQLLSL